MQKKIIALAVAGLVSGAAFAQSNVTIYGIVDMAYIAANDSSISGAKSYSAINAGGINGNRVGFRGEEDLGNDLSAKFHAVMAFQGDSGAAGQSYGGTGPLMRWSTVSLASKSWGEIEMGRRDTFQDQLLGDVSANGRTMVAQVSPVYVDTARYNNLVAYLSPVWSGFQVKAGFATNSQAQDVPPTDLTLAANNTAANTNTRAYALAALYNNGPLKLGVSYERNKMQNRDNSIGVDSSYESGNTWDIAGAYDFGVVRIDGAYGQINYAENTMLASGAETKDSRKQWTVGLSAPVGANGNVSLVYAHAKVDYLNSTWSNDKVSLWGLAYKHNLSKRTIAYAAYGKIDQEDNSRSLVSLSGTPGDSSAYQQGFQVGLRHAF